MKNQLKYLMWFAVILLVFSNCQPKGDPPPNNSKPLSTLKQLWLCEAMRLREASGERLADREANRHARNSAGTLSQRIVARTLWLAERDGQLAALGHYQQGAHLALAILLLLAVFMWWLKRQ